MAGLAIALAYLVGGLGLLSAVFDLFPSHRGTDGIAGAILLGAAVIATTIRGRLASAPSASCRRR